MFDVSESAVNRIKEISLKENQEFFRISVDGGGCQGFSYKFNFDKKIGTEDKILNFQDVKILLEQTSLSFIKGSKLDFVTDIIG